MVNDFMGKLGDCDCFSSISKEAICSVSTTASSFLRRDSTAQDIACGDSELTRLRMETQEGLKHVVDELHDAKRRALDLMQSLRETQEELERTQRLLQSKERLFLAQDKELQQLRKALRASEAVVLSFSKQDSSCPGSPLYSYRTTDSSVTDGLGQFPIKLATARVKPHTAMLMRIL